MLGACSGEILKDSHSLQLT